MYIIYITVLLHKTALKLNICTDVIASGYRSKQFLKVLFQTEQFSHASIYWLLSDSDMQCVGALCVYAGGLWNTDSFLELYQYDSTTMHSYT